MRLAAGAELGRGKRQRSTAAYQDIQERDFDRLCRQGVEEGQAHVPLLRAAGSAAARPARHGGSAAGGTERCKTAAVPAAQAPLAVHGGSRKTRAATRGKATRLDAADTLQEEGSAGCNRDEPACHLVPAPQASQAAAVDVGAWPKAGDPDEAPTHSALAGCPAAAKQEGRGTLEEAGATDPSPSASLSNMAARAKLPATENSITQAALGGPGRCAAQATDEAAAAEPPPDPRPTAAQLAVMDAKADGAPGRGSMQEASTGKRRSRLDELADAAEVAQAAEAGAGQGAKRQKRAAVPHTNRAPSSSAAAKGEQGQPEHEHKEPPEMRTTSAEAAAAAAVEAGLLVLSGLEAGLKQCAMCGSTTSSAGRWRRHPTTRVRRPGALPPQHPLKTGTVLSKAFLCPHATRRPTCATGAALRFPGTRRNKAALTLWAAGWKRAQRRRSQSVGPPLARASVWLLVWRMQRPQQRSQ